MSVALMPAPKMQFLDNNGKPLAGGLIATFQAGTSTPLATYTDSTGSVANANPVVLDAGGFANIWLLNQGYKIVVKDLNSVTQYTVDNVFGLASTTRILNYQKVLAPITGNGTDRVMYTYDMSAGILAAGQGIRITVVFTHTTGTAVVTAKVNVGGGSITPVSNALTAVQVIQAYFINDPGSHTSNAMFDSVVVGAGAGSSYSAVAVDTSVIQTITATFSVANTDQVTPQAFLVETI